MMMPLHSMTARQRGEVDRAQALSDPGLATADDCNGGEEVSRVGLRCPKHLMSCTITLAHTLPILMPILTPHAAIPRNRFSFWKWKLYNCVPSNTLQNFPHFSSDLPRAVGSGEARLFSISEISKRFQVPGFEWVHELLFFCLASNPAQFCAEISCGKTELEHNFTLSESRMKNEFSAINDWPRPTVQTA